MHYICSASGGQRGVYFVFRDQGACATLLAVHVFYVTCPSIVTSLAAFLETPAGPEITSIVQRHGVCVANSVASDAGPPTYLCKADGSWYFLSGGCQCRPGYEPHNETSRCIGRGLVYLANAYHHYFATVPLVRRKAHSALHSVRPSVCQSIRHVTCNTPWSASSMHDAWCHVTKAMKMVES